ncbi:MAG TPA: polysaccharide biosynthesis/export family protein [Opitutaceae bacterium]|nr:polysaccharide biosynthesis/export family protein [Opitutaceae bacterium]
MSLLLSSFRFFAVVLLAGALGSAGFAQVAPATSKLDDKNAIPYRITRGDVLSVAVFGEPDLTIGGKKVEARGVINLPLINEIRLVGMTVGEAKATIEKAYYEGRFLRNPEVTVSIEQYAQRIVIVNGKVGAPGRYELPPDQQWTLKDIISKANGLSDTAKGSDVRVQRTMPDGSIKIFEGLDVDSVLRGKAKAKSEAATFILQPDDIVYVPERII